jgi:hypothetical protein
MTHQHQSSPFQELVQVLSDEGFDGMAHALEILLNETMKIERSQTLPLSPTSDPTLAGDTPMAKVCCLAIVHRCSSIEFY